MGTWGEGVWKDINGPERSWGCFACPPSFEEMFLLCFLHSAGVGLDDSVNKKNGHGVIPAPLHNLCISSG